MRTCVHAPDGSEHSLVRVLLPQRCMHKLRECYGELGVCCMRARVCVCVFFLCVCVHRCMLDGGCVGVSFEADEDTSADNNNNAGGKQQRLSFGSQQQVCVCVYVAVSALVRACVSDIQAGMQFTIGMEMAACVRACICVCVCV